MERSLGLMCGAGVLPARMATEARRRGWRVVAFTFSGAPDVAALADRVIPARIAEIGAVLAHLQSERCTAALFSGSFSMGDILRTRESEADATSLAIRDGAGSRIDARLASMAISALAAIGVEVLDQREFVGDWLQGAGCWTKRAPTASEWEDVRRGFAVARMLADARVGQTIVVKEGAIAAVEAAEGTTAAVRRGVALGGAGAVVVKAVAREHDYRFDTPTVGPETIAAAAAGPAAVVAVEAGRVLILERDATILAADQAGIALVSVDADRA
ncbi:MAG: UDP-2,3-diacylglucosamine diphosphatase LpxI [Candidatus Rokubacteria bacterium]|nr:UDP-2,3-diacylglucosamine diphosphatase LpxI [Candidatus Rokubacteria bacterium]